MEPNQAQSKPKTTAKDFFLNLGAIVALFTTVIALVNLLFRVINSAFPQINSYYGSTSISFPVATLIIFFPIYVLLMWILERGYKTEPAKPSLEGSVARPVLGYREKKFTSVRRWLSYITLFIAGLALAGDLVTVLYFFLDGQELSAGFMLKVLSVLVIALMVFIYYISDIREKLTPLSRKAWLAGAVVLVAGSIIWGFVVLGSPYTQRLYKYDNQKEMDLQSLNSYIESYYSMQGSLPATIQDVVKGQPYAVIPVDPQTGEAYEYIVTGDTSYRLCADFNKPSRNEGNRSLVYPYGGIWNHPAGYHCLDLSVNPNMYTKPIPVLPR